MPELTLVTYHTVAADLDMSRITDLALQTPTGGGAAVLYATTRYDGAISAWDVVSGPGGDVGGGLTRIDSAAHLRGDAAGAGPDLGFVQIGGTLSLLSGGGTNGALMLYGLQADGSFDAGRSLGSFSALGGDLAQTVTLTLGNGTQMVYGGIIGNDGIGRLHFAPGATSPTAVGLTPDTGAVHAGRVVALADAQVGGTHYLFSASTTDTGLTAWRVASNGALVATAHLNPGNGLWVSAPTALATVQVDGATFLILAAAGSGSLTVVEVSPAGLMRITDHVLDDLNSRFDGVTALTTVSHDGHSYIIAGGADDGISLYQLLPGGRLLARAHLADTTSMGLANISAIVAQSTPAGIEIFVASGQETGLTQLLFDPGASGITANVDPDISRGATGASLTGTAGRDLLRGDAGTDRLDGAAGDDLLIDGAGRDTLTGGAGADTFVLTADDSTDTISDFTLGQDKIDLSGWGLLRSLSQLSMTSTATGFTIGYGSEVLVVHSADGLPVALSGLTLADLVNLTRIPTDLAPFTSPPPPANTITGTAGADELTGLPSADRIYGGAGNDMLYGGGGHDTLYGGAGADTLDGGTGNDMYILTDGTDLILETTGFGSADIVASAVSYTLSAGVEIEQLMTIQDNGTTALTLIGNALAQTITGNAGANILHTGGGAADTLSGLGGDDIYRVYNAADRVIEAVGMGTDRVSAGINYTLAAGVHVEQLTTLSSTGTGTINLTGNALTQAITGNAGANVLSSGGGAADILSGLGGNDHYRVYNSADQVRETTGMGTDSALAAVSYALAAGQEIEALATINSAATTAINLTGNALAQRLSGNAGANILSDGGGAGDVLAGLGGNDTYIIRAVGSQIIEAASDGIDRVITTVSFVLATGAEVEQISTNAATATTAINLTGNALTQAITGNAGANVLSSGGGAADILSGLGGHDIYHVYHAADRIIETAVPGIDRVCAAVSYVLAAGVQVEQMQTIAVTATTAINLTGNALTQAITGNAGANVLSTGGGAADILSGLGGNDQYRVYNRADQVREASGMGTDAVLTAVSYALAAGQEIEALATINSAATTAINLTGNALAQRLSGNAGANQLNGGAGSDTLTGGGGADRFVFSTGLGAGNVDRITDFAAGVDDIQLLSSLFAAIGASLTATEFRIGAAVDGNDFILYNSATGALTYDSNGNGIGGASQFATLTAGLGLSFGDFLVI